MAAMLRSGLALRRSSTSLRLPAARFLWSPASVSCSGNTAAGKKRGGNEGKKKGDESPSGGAKDGLEAKTARRRRPAQERSSSYHTFDEDYALYAAADLLDAVSSRHKAAASVSPSTAPEGTAANEVSPPVPDAASGNSWLSSWFSGDTSSSTGGGGSWGSGGDYSDCSGSGD